MRRILPLGLVCLLAFTSVADAQGLKRRTAKLPRHSMSTAYTVQTVSVKTGCFPSELQAILAHIAVKTGRRPLVTSGFRPHARRSHSQHRHCNAADIRVPGVSERAIVAAAATAPGIGGIGRYCNGIVHVDIGPKRRWVDC